MVARLWCGGSTARSRAESPGGLPVTCMPNEELPLPAEGFSWRWPTVGPVLQCDALCRAGFAHFFTTRLTELPADLDVPSPQWDALAREAGVPASRLHRMRQVHGSAVACVDGTGHHPSGEIPIGPADILIGRDPEQALSVRVADCVPLLLADPRSGAAAAAHVGWRGAAAHVPRVAVEALMRTYGASPHDLLAAAGPSIGPCCYVVGPELWSAFVESGHAPARADGWFRPDGDGRVYLDLWQSTRDQLLDAGIRPDHLHVAQCCTASAPEVFSSFRVLGHAAGRMVGVIRPLPGSAA